MNLEDWWTPAALAAHQDDYLAELGKFGQKTEGTIREGENAELAEGVRDGRLHDAERASTDATHAAGQRLAAVLRAAGHTESQGTWDWVPTEGWTVSPAWDEGSQGVHHVTTPEDHAGRRAGLRAYAATLEAAGVPYRWRQETIDGQPYETIQVRVEADPSPTQYLIGADYLPGNVEIALCPHCKSAVPVGHRPNGRCWYCRHRPDWQSVGHAPQ